MSPLQDKDDRPMARPGGNRRGQKGRKEETALSWESFLARSPAATARVVAMAGVSETHIYAPRVKREVVQIS